MIAPVPYSASTKLAIQIGTGLPVNGLIALRPVSKPSFSMAPVSRASRSRARNCATCSRNAVDPALSRREPIDHPVLRRQQHERRAVDRVDPGGEDLDGVVAVGERELDARALGAADPVPLHHDDFFRPLGERLEARQELVGIGGDAEEPLLQIAGRRPSAAAPAGAVDHLLVGQHRVVSSDTS